MSFKNKVVIVIGASSGIGAATAIQFVSEGADVVIIGRNEAKLKEVSRKCESKGKKPLTIVADISNDEKVKKIVNDSIAKYGKLDVLVNNAAKGHSYDILYEHALEVFDDIKNTNLRSVVYLTNLVTPHLVKTKGNIVNISSIAALMVTKGRIAYSSTKAGLDHFTKSVALELATKGVRVNVVNPGPVRTDILENKGFPKAKIEKRYEEMAKISALGRVSESEEIADLVIYLASDKARSITGSSFVIDVGYMLTELSNPDLVK